MSNNNETTWSKMPALTEMEAGLRSGCLTCGPQPVTLPPDARIAVGFGAAGVTKDGVAIWEEDTHADYEHCMTCAEAERTAALDPDHDWRIYYFGPLSEAVYQRHAPGEWVLIEKGQGFA